MTQKIIIRLQRNFMGGVCSGVMAFFLGGGGAGSFRCEPKDQHFCTPFACVMWCKPCAKQSTYKFVYLGL